MILLRFLGSISTPAAAMVDATTTTLPYDLMRNPAMDRRAA